MEPLTLAQEEAAAPPRTATVAAPGLGQVGHVFALSRERIGLATAAALATAWAGLFGSLAVIRHLAGGSHAEDLGFTDQVLWNFLHGQFFRMSIYNGGSWNTEIDVSSIARPDSLLAFHVEPMLLGFVPLYALGAGTIALLIIQAVVVAAGAVPAYRLGRHLTRSAICGVVIAAAYLLSPLGQWAVLADFHTSTLAAPLLLLSLERLIVARAPVQALIVAGIAASAREDVGAVLVGLGFALFLTYRPRWVAGAYVILGAAWTLAALAVLHHYSGGVSPFDVRYGPTLGNGLAGAATALTRPTVVGYAVTLLLSGGWLGLLAPLALLPAVPSLALNALSSSIWMASGQAHYSGLVLPFIVFGAAAGLARLAAHRRLLHAATVVLAVTSLVAYVRAGAGPLGANYAPAVLTDHSARAAAIAGEIPPSAAVSASSALVPRVSQRSHIYVFPSVLDADAVFLDLTASPAPTSAGDVYLRVQQMLASGDWHTAQFEDGLLLLERSPAEAPPAPASPAAPSGTAPATPPKLISAALVPSPDGAVGVDSPQWLLRTVWQTDAPLPSGTGLDFWIRLRSGEEVHVADIAPLWWNPPSAWPAHQQVTVDVPGIPVREFASWSATWSTP